MVIGLRALRPQNPISAIFGSLSPDRYASVVFLTRMHTNGIGITEALDRLRDAGLMVSNGPARQWFRELNKASRSKKIWDTTPEFRRMEPKLMARLKPTNTDKYAFPVRVTGFNLVTQEQETRYFTIGFNDNRTRRWIENKAIEIASSVNDSYKMVNIEVVALTPRSRVSTSPI